MRKSLSIMSCVLLATAAAAGDAVTRLGEPLTEGLEITSIEEIVADPDGWAGKRVRISGEVEGVCAMQGCWMDLVSPDDATLRVKVEDGVIVFPPEAVGQWASVEGTVEILEMTREDYVAWMGHVAEEEERKLDPESIGEGPFRIVRLRGHGAEIGAS